MNASCIIIPCYNEEKRLPMQEFIDYFAENTDVDFCFVNDGSSDSTGSMLEALCRRRPSGLMYFNLPHNSGKAEAVRKGALYCLAMNKYSRIGFWDADLATPLSEIGYLSSFLDKNEKYAFAFGSRIKTLGVIIERKLLRHYFGRVFATFASGVVQLPVYDTQCGAKILKADVAKLVFSEAFSSKWLFDIEIFARIIETYGHNEAMSMMVEVPLRQWIDKGDSRITLSYLIKMPFELFSIYRKHRRNLRKL